MTSLTVILSEKQNEWPVITEKNKESHHLPTSTTTTTADMTTANSPPSSSSSSSPTEAAQQPFRFIGIVKEKKMNQCTFCPKKFTKPSALKAHLYSHTGEKPHSCPHAGCHRHFSLLSNLRRHIKIHVPTALKKHQHHHIQPHRGNNHPPHPSSEATTNNKRRVPTLLPSPYTPSVKIFPGSAPLHPASRV